MFFYYPLLEERVKINNEYLNLLLLETLVPDIRPQRKIKQQKLEAKVCH